MTALWTDFRLAIRTWLRTPSLAAVVMVTLALGIGATTAAFTLAYTVLIQPLPFPQPERLVWVSSYNTRTSDGSGHEAGTNRLSQFIDWQAHARSFEQLGAWAGEGYDIFTITGSGAPERVNGVEVTQQVLPMFGATAAIGTLFRDGDDRVGAPRTVVLTYGFWQRRFGGRNDVVGRTLIIDNDPYTIVGILREDFLLSSSLPIGAPLDIYLPFVLDPRKEDFGGFMTVIGRLRRGVTSSQASAEIAARQLALAAQRSFMSLYAQTIAPLAGQATRRARTPLLLLFGGVAVVLLMACANLANLLLIRSTERRRDIQIRAALGGTMGRMFRQTLAESAVVVTVGGGVGLALAVVLIRTLRATSWVDLPRLPDAHVGAAAVLFAIATCVAITFVFGSLPLLYLRRRDLMDALRPHGGITSDRRAVRVQRIALVGQVAFAMTLCVAGLLLFRSIVGLLRVDPGFRPEGAIALRVDPASRLRVPERMPFFTRLLGAVHQVTGVQTAAISINLPMDRNMMWDVAIPGQPFRPGVDGAYARIVSPGYFRAVGIPLIAGRDFDDRDREKTPLVVAINETLARRVGPNAIGKTITLNGRDREIIAVVHDVKHRGLDADPGSEFYVSYLQTPGWQTFDLVVRAADPSALVPAIRSAIQRVDPEQAVGAPVPLQQLIDRTTKPRRLLTWLLGAFAATALVFAALGVYGIVGYRVARRAKETALRVALGATQWRVMSQVFGDAIATALIGVLVAIPLSLMTGSVVRSFLFGITPQDPTAFVGGLVALLAITLIGAYIPARRAARVDVMTTLRLEG